MSWIRTHLLATATVLAAAALAAWLLLRPGSPAYTVQIAFADAAGLRQYGDVEMHGARVGEITALGVSRADTAIATVKLFRPAAPLRAGTSAAIRPTGLVGDSYIDLTAGSGRRLQSGATIPVSHTSESVGLDQILDVLDPGTRARLRILINEAGIGMLGRGSNLGQLLAALPNSLESSSGLLGQIRSADAELQDLIARGDRVLRELSPARDSLVKLIDGTQTALGAAAARHTALSRTVAGAPSALAQLRRALGDLATTATQLRPAARGLTATAPPLTQTLAQLPGLAASSRKALAAARSVAPTLGRLGRQGTAPVAALARTAPHLDTFARALGPTLAVMDSGGTVELLDFIDGWAQAMSTTDSVGRVFRLDLSLGPALVNLAVGTLARSPHTHAGGSGATPGSAPVKRIPSRATSQPSPTAAAATPSTAAIAPPHPQPSAPPSNSLSSLLDYLLGR